MNEQTTSPAHDTGQTFCANHPQTTTSLRCNQCEQYICARCAVRTPIGYRCKQCIKGQQAAFNTAGNMDLLLSIPVALLIGLLGSLLSIVVGFFMFFIAPVIGAGAAEAVRFIVQKRRSKMLFLSAAGAIVASCLPVAILDLVTGNFYGLVWLGVYAFLASTTTYYRLTGISIKL